MLKNIVSGIYLPPMHGQLIAAAVLQFSLDFSTCPKTGTLCVKVGPKPVFIPLSNICIQSCNFPGLLVEYIINMRLVSWHGSVSLVSCQADTVTDFTSSSRIQTLCCHNLSELAATRNIKNCANFSRELFVLLLF